MKAIILHGTEGSPTENWFGWLKEELEKTGFEVWAPQLPNADKPSLKEWTDFVLKNCPFDIDEKTILAGHSSGGILVLTVLQELKKKARAGICVAAFKDNNFLKWEALTRLFDVDLNFEEIKKHVSLLTFIQSDDDPYVPMEHAKFLASKTNGQLVIMHDCKHFNVGLDPRFTKFPELLKIIKEKAE